MGDRNRGTDTVESEKQEERTNGLNITYTKIDGLIKKNWNS